LRTAARDDKLAANILALIKLTAIRIWLRVYESTSWMTQASAFFWLAMKQFDGWQNHFKLN
jgi:hypothetical protein